MRTTGSTLLKLDAVHSKLAVQYVVVGSSGLGYDCLTEALWINRVALVQVRRARPLLKTRAIFVDAFFSQLLLHPLPQTLIRSVPIVMQRNKEQLAKAICNFGDPLKP